MDISWHPGATVLSNPAELRVEESDDLITWRLHSRHILPKSQSGPWQAQISINRSKGFYRILSNFNVELVRAEAADALGYGDLFKAELARVGQITPEQLAALYPDQQNYLPAIGWDPTTATFFAQFQSAPPPGTRDFRLNPVELALLRTNGFVVSSRISQTNFTDLYYDIFVRDLPVYVTADSILHAWFKSYETILENLEELYLANALKEVLKGMADELVNIAPAVGEGPLRQSLLDADYYLTVARSLTGDSVQSRFGQDGLVSSTLAAVSAEEYRLFNLFGRELFFFDFSQFKVRSHYTRSQILSNYFKAMMWCGRVDLRIAGNPRESSPRELGTALILHEAIVRSGKLPMWTDMDAAIRAFMGNKDSMDFNQMAQILRSAGLNSLSDIKSLTDLERIKSAIDEGKFGIQEILSDTYVSPFGPQQVWLPRSFTVFGQRFTFDAWAFGKVVFDQILWRNEGATPAKIVRRRASGLDAAFAVLQNNAAVPEIIARIQNSDGVRFRDGLPYQHNLAAVRAVIDQQQEESWHSSVYSDWLFTLRVLSEPMTDSRFPDAMRTRPWALRRLNTQLASWTQLRHTSVLYAKQTYVPIYLCFYPAGFVEPNPRFWEALQTMASSTRAAIDRLPMEGTAQWQARVEGPPRFTARDLAALKAGQITFLNRFASNVATLKSLAEKELRREPFSTNETMFLLSLVELQWEYVERKYTGWYPALYYGAYEGYDSFSHFLPSPAPGTTREYVPDFRKGVPLVTDVLTAPPDDFVGDPGAVIHEAVGNVQFMLVAVDNGPDRMVYGGPVFSHYEFDVEGVRRLNDSEWQTQLDRGTGPPAPDWTRTWLAPK